MYFSPKLGELEISSWYADNEKVLQEISFCVPFCEWNEFENSRLFRDIKTYVDGFCQQTQDTRIDTHVPQCTEETEGLIENSNQEGCSLSFSALARKLFHCRKSTR